VSLTKSQVSRLVVTGHCRETFSHETLGHFDVTGIRQLAIAEFPEVMVCAFSAMTMADGIQRDALAYLIANREVDHDRCLELTTEQLQDPLIFLLCPAGTNGEGESHLLVDGIHRLVAGYTRGYSDFRFRMVPMDRAPRFDPGDFTNVEWGDKELVLGVGLVDRMTTK
jgi:hypothetical protein